MGPVCLIISSVIVIIVNYVFSCVRITRLCVSTFKFHACIKDAVNWWLEQIWQSILRSGVNSEWKNVITAKLL